MQRFCPTVGRFCVQKGFPHLFALQAKGKDFLSAKTKRCDLRRNVAKTPIWQKSGRNACPLQCLPPQKKGKKIPLRKEAGRALVCYVRYQSHLTGTFDCNGKFSLMTGAHTCHTAGKNFSAFREILFEFCNVLVIDGLCLFDAEVTNLSACRLSYRFFNFFVFHIGFLLV